VELYLEGGIRSLPCCRYQEGQKRKYAKELTDQSCSFASPKGWVAMIGERGRGIKRMARKRSL
jgi:hypothetical protein